MARPVFVGASAAAMLPAALAAAVLVSAPFAGTTTTPLAAEQPVHHGVTSTRTPQLRLTPVGHDGMSAGGWAALTAAEAAFLGLGFGVAVVTWRRRSAES
jgi:hypothetical protein